jgi:serine/threonine protein kinase
MAIDSTIIDDADGGTADVPDHVGPYRIVRLLGRGGMGSVYLGTRDDDQFKRRVAVKVIRRGMDTDDVLKRFAVERQILTALNHPGIARVFDAGQTEDGRPYVVMEYIEGLPLDAYCDKNRLNTEDRLKLFTKVCAAVHVAHQNQIVHRDLKPSNVLVTPDGEPKLLDFGIAKLLNPELAAVTLVTGPELRVMTPEYASPEQAGGDPITTASDVYSLGVMLYELLTGKRPYTFKTRVRDEVLRVVQEVEPAAPSTAITQSEQITTASGETKVLTPEDLARVRESTVDRLRRRLRGDLDNIVMMALQKTPKRRYASASEFSADIQRHLQGYPVIARPDSVRYSVSRLIRRHRGRFLFTGAVAISLLTGLSIAVWQAGRVRQRDVQLQQVRTFAGEFVQSLAQSISRTEGSLPARKALIDSSTQILNYMASSFPEDEQLRRLRANALRLLADAQGGRGQNFGNIDGAVQHYAEALKILEEQSRRSPADLDLLADVAGTRTALASAKLDRGEAEVALAALDDTIAMMRASSNGGQLADRLLGELSTATLLRSKVHMRMNNREAAEQDLDESLGIRQRLLAREPSNLEYVRNLTVAITRKGEMAANSEPPQLPAALAHFQEVLNRRKAIDAIVNNSSSKRDVAMARKFMGDTLSRLARVEEARTELLTALETLIALRGANDLDARSRWDVVELYYSLAHLEADANQPSTMADHLRSALNSALNLPAGEATRRQWRLVIDTVGWLADWLCKNDQNQEASQEFDRVDTWLRTAPNTEESIASLERKRAESGCFHNSGE